MAFLNRAHHAAEPRNEIGGHDMVIAVLPEIGKNATVISIFIQYLRSHIYLKIFITKVSAT
jgi:hypothetical protein